MGNTCVHIYKNARIMKRAKFTQFPDCLFRVFSIFHILYVLNAPRKNLMQKFQGIIDVSFKSNIHRQSLKLYLISVPARRASMTAHGLFSCSWAFVDVGRSMGAIYPCQLAARTGCDHWLLTCTISGGSAVLGQGGGAPIWSVVVHRVHRLWGFQGGAGQGQPPLVFCLGPLCMSYKAIWDGCYLCWAWRFPGEAQL